MQGKKLFLDQEMVRFRLSERVPPHNLYRRLAELVDWDFLYDETLALYSHTGQPSLDPVVFFKLALVGRLENLVRDRRLVEHAAQQARLAAHSSVPGSQHEKARLLSNKTHYSPTDPDARISIKPGKAQALNYLCSLAVDTAKGVISHVQADFADSRDSLHLP